MGAQRDVYPNCHGLTGCKPYPLAHLCTFKWATEFEENDSTMFRLMLSESPASHGQHIREGRKYALGDWALTLMKVDLHTPTLSPCNGFT